MLLKMFFLLLIISVEIVTMTRIIDFDVPEQVLEGNPVLMKCEFDLNGERLFRVKWLKDDEEFFIFGMIENPKVTYPVRGVYLDINHSNATFVRLYTTDLNSQGVYTCEVQTKETAHRYSWAHSYLNIVPIHFDNQDDLGEDLKKISELDSRYSDHNFNFPSIELPKEYEIAPLQTTPAYNPNILPFREELEFPNSKSLSSTPSTLSTLSTPSNLSTPSTQSTPSIPSISSIPSTPFYHRLFESKTKTNSNRMNGLFLDKPSFRATVEKITRESYDEWPNKITEVEAATITTSSSACKKLLNIGILIQYNLFMFNIFKYLFF